MKRLFNRPGAVFALVLAIGLLLLGVARVMGWW
jgi:hypothetical protein